MISKLSFLRAGACMAISVAFFMTAWLLNPDVNYHDDVVDVLIYTGIPVLVISIFYFVSSFRHIWNFVFAVVITAVFFVLVAIKAFQFDVVHIPEESVMPVLNTQVANEVFNLNPVEPTPYKVALTGEKIFVTLILAKIEARKLDLINLIKLGSPLRNKFNADIDLLTQHEESLKEILKNMPNTLIEYEEYEKIYTNSVVYSDKLSVDVDALTNQWLDKYLVKNEDKGEIFNPDFKLKKDDVVIPLFLAAFKDLRAKANQPYTSNIFMQVKQIPELPPENWKKGYFSSILNIIISCFVLLIIVTFSLDFKVRRDIFR